MKYFKFLLMVVFVSMLSVNTNAGSIKVENLTAETTTAAGDELILTDISDSNDTNKITLTNFFVTVPVAITSSAVITGLTVEATGDTASSDNSAMGYTAAEGLILTGQGSTNDVTIKNDADTVVAAIQTGTTDFDIVGVGTAATFEPDGDTSASDNAAIGYAAADGIVITGQGSTNDITMRNDADAAVLVVPTGTTNFDIVGVATAETFEPDSDTAAGDNAAIGYTATEGIVITGQGSTYDVAIKNDADAIVASILTGTTNFDIVGTGTAALFRPDGDTNAGLTAAIGYAAADGLILTGQGSTNDISIRNDADANVIVIPTGTTNADVVGVLTAATMEPDGDTSAGDNSAIGYTAAEGIVITGQGSTYDVVIKNDADAIAMSILTGTTDVAIIGTTTHGGAVVDNVVNLSADVTTFPIGTGTIFYTGSNTQATAITDVTGGTAGQIFTIVTTGGADWTTIADSGNFNIAGSGGFAPDSADDSITFLVVADNEYIQIYGTQTNN